MERGDVLLAPFLYSDLQGGKRRPACVVSSAQYKQGPDVIVAMVTSSQPRLNRPGLGDEVLDDWRSDGLLRASVARIGRLLVLDRRLLGGKIGQIRPARTNRTRRRTPMAVQ